MGSSPFPTYRIHLPPDCEHCEQRIISQSWLTRRGKQLVAIVPIEDLEVLRAAEDSEDLRACASGHEALYAVEAAGRLPAVANFEEFLGVVQSLADTSVGRTIEAAVNREAYQLLGDISFAAGPDAKGWSAQRWLEHLKSIHGDTSNPFHERLRQVAALKSSLRPVVLGDPYVELAAKLWRRRPGQLDYDACMSARLRLDLAEGLRPVESDWIKASAEHFLYVVPKDIPDVAVPPFLSV